MMMTKVSELREGDTFAHMGGTFSVVRAVGGGSVRTIHLEHWGQGQGAELRLYEGEVVMLLSRLPDEELERIEEARRQALIQGLKDIWPAGDAEQATSSLLSFLGSCADPDEPEWTDEDLEINANERREALLAELDELRFKANLKTRWQQPLAEWQQRELPCEDEAKQRLRLALGVAEEAGEVARCVLKGDQGIRGGADAWRAKLGGEIGDVVIYLIQLATLNDLDFEECVEGAVCKVLARRFASAEESGDD